MDVIEFVSLLRQFNADTVLIGAAVWGLTLLLKKTVLKKLPKKLLTFVQAVAQGVACGSLATVIHVVCRQFSAGGTQNTKAACVKAMLAPYRTLEDEEAAALALAVESDEAAARGLLAEYAGEAGDVLYPLLAGTLAIL